MSGAVLEKRIAQRFGQILSDAMTLVGGGKSAPVPGPPTVNTPPSAAVPAPRVTGKLVARRGGTGRTVGIVCWVCVILAALAVLMFA